MYRSLIRFLRLCNIDCNSDQLKVVPNSVIIASTFLSISAVGQWALDLTCELLAQLDILPEIPFRINFITLTFLSALLAWQTFRSLQHNELVITNSALQVAFLVETGLVLGDIHFLTRNLDNVFLIFFRMPFVTLTIINIALVLYIYFRLRFFKAKAPERQVHKLEGYRERLGEVVLVPNPELAEEESYV